MPTIGFLHTSPVHTPTFERLVAELGEGVATETVVDESLLHDARRLGPDDPVVLAGIDVALKRLEDAGVELAVCTCSTIGGEAERLGKRRSLRVVRVDRAMAEAAVGLGRRIAVVAAVDSTVAPTRSLIESVAADRGVVVEISVVSSDGAWERFEAGDADGYLGVVADTCASLDGTVDVIVLAQASMAGAVDLLPIATPVLCSPRLAVASAVELAGRGPDAGKNVPGVRRS